MEENGIDDKLESLAERFVPLVAKVDRRLREDAGFQKAVLDFYFSFFQIWTGFKTFDQILLDLPVGSHSLDEVAREVFLRAVRSAGSKKNKRLIRGFINAVGVLSVRYSTEIIFEKSEDGSYGFGMVPSRGSLKRVYVIKGKTIDMVEEDDAGAEKEESMERFGNLGIYLDEIEIRDLTGRKKQLDYPPPRRRGVL